VCRWAGPPTPCRVPPNSTPHSRRTRLDVALARRDIDSCGDGHAFNHAAHSSRREPIAACRPELLTCGTGDSMIHATSSTPWHTGPAAIDSVGVVLGRGPTLPSLHLGAMLSGKPIFHAGFMMALMESSKTFLPPSNSSPTVDSIDKHGQGRPIFSPSVASLILRAAPSPERRTPLPSPGRWGRTPLLG
jgi:hypothetical protein